jgi:hypothetical protein
MLKLALDNFKICQHPINKDYLLIKHSTPLHIDSINLNEIGIDLCYDNTLEGYVANSYYLDKLIEAGANYKPSIQNLDSLNDCYIMTDNHVDYLFIPKALSYTDYLNIDNITLYFNTELGGYLIWSNLNRLISLGAKCCNILSSLSNYTFIKKDSKYLLIPPKNSLAHSYIKLPSTEEVYKYDEVLDGYLIKNSPKNLGAVEVFNVKTIKNLDKYTVKLNSNTKNIQWILVSPNYFYDFQIGNRIYTYDLNIGGYHIEDLDEVLILGAKLDTGSYCDLEGWSFINHPDRKYWYILLPPAGTDLKDVLLVKDIYRPLTSKYDGYEICFKYHNKLIKYGAIKV